MSEVAITNSVELQLHNGRGSELQIIGGLNCSSIDTMSCKNKYIARLVVNGKTIAEIPSNDDVLFHEFQLVIKEYLANKKKGF